MKVHFLRGRVDLVLGLMRVERKLSEEVHMDLVGLLVSLLVCDGLFEGLVFEALRSLSFLLVDRACRYGCRLNGCERREVVRERLEVL